MIMYVCNYWLGSDTSQAGLCKDDKMRRRLCFLTKGHDVYKGFRERKDIKSILPH